MARWDCFALQLVLDLGRGLLVGETGVLVAVGGNGVANEDVVLSCILCVQLTVYKLFCTQEHGGSNGTLAHKRTHAVHHCYQYIKSTLSKVTAAATVLTDHYH